MTGPPARDRLDAMIGQALFAEARLDPKGGLAGFLIGFAPDARYDSPNFLWFRAWIAGFAYIDRVVVTPEARGGGVGRALYADFAAAAARHGLTCLACEVNITPPNPGSGAFHAALGFAETGTGTPAPGKRVRYLLRDIDVSDGPEARGARDLPASTRL
jgi:uncharacterized protein